MYQKCLTLWCQTLDFEKQDERKLKATTMRMSYMMQGKTLKDGIYNQTICKMTDMEFVSEQKLRWFAHMKRLDDERTPVKAKNFVVVGSKKGRLKKRWIKGVKDMLITGLDRMNAQSAFYRGLVAKTSSPCSLDKQARFHKDEDIYQHFWNK